MTKQSELTERYKGTGIYGDAYYLTPGNTVFNRFSFGQHVKALGFEDSRGDWHDEIRGLVVESVKIVGLRWNQENMEMVPHVRVKAVDPDSYGYFEAAEHFFDAENQPSPE